jgi:hypothetical protein
VKEMINNTHVILNNFEAQTLLLLVFKKYNFFGGEPNGKLK